MMPAGDLPSKPQVQYIGRAPRALPDTTSVEVHQDHDTLVPLSAECTSAALSPTALGRL